MKEPFIITEHEFPVPGNIRLWANERNIPIINTVLDFTKIEADYIVEYSPDISLLYLDMIHCHSTDKPATIGITDRIVIREIWYDDLPAFFELIKKYPDTLKHRDMLSIPLEEFTERHKAYIRYSYHFLVYGLWGLFLKDAPSKLIGIAGIDGIEEKELSYALFPSFEGKGYAYEACSYILKFSEDLLDIKDLTLNILSSNTRSLDLAQKLKNSYPNLKINLYHS